MHNSEKNNSNFMGCMINGNSGNGSNAGSAYVNANNTLGNANANIAACNLATAPMASAKDFSCTCTPAESPAKKAAAADRLKI